MNRITAGTLRRGREFLASLSVLVLLVSGCQSSVETVAERTPAAGAGDSGPVTPVIENVIAPINTPNTLKASGGTSRISLAWTPPEKTSPVRFVIFRRPLSGGNFLQIATSQVMSYADTTVTNGTAYVYRVQSVLADGTTFDTNETSAQSIANFMIRSLVQDSSGNFTMTWDPAAGAASYDIVQGPGGGIYPDLLKANATSPATIAGIPAGSASFFQVIARNAVGDGAKVLSATVFRAVGLPAFDFTLTNEPAGMTATWPALTGVDGYEVVWGTAPGNYSSSAWVAAGSASFSTWDTTPGTTYYFMVYAYGGASKRAASTERSLQAAGTASLSWGYDAGTEAQYTSNNSFATTQLTASGYFSLKQILFQDVDAAGFGAGTASGLAWDSTRNVLRLGSAGGCDGRTTSCAASDQSVWLPRPKNLIGHWKLDGSGTVTNGGTVSATVGANGTAITPSGVMSYGAGKAGQSLQFDGIDDEIDVGNGAAYQLTRGSFSAWINTANAGSGYRGIVIKQMAYGLFMNSNTLVIYDWTVGERSSGINISDGTWHHVLVTFVAGVTGGTSLYVDGVHRFSTTISIANQTVPLKIGSGNCCGQIFTGKIDEVMLWNSVLNADEARAVYQRGLGKYSGQLQSRVFDAGIAAAWPNLSWVSKLPFGKELPGSATSEQTTAYASLNSGALMSGNIGLWHLNETAAGTAPGGKDYRDDSGGGNHGTNAGASYGQTGRFGSAAGFFNPLGISLGTPAFLRGATSMSVCAWMDYTGIADNVSHTIMRQQDGGNGQFAFGFGWNPHKLRLWVNNGGWQAGPDSTTSVDDGRWHHVCGTFANSAVSIYVDGVREASAAVSASALANTVNPLHIGAYYAGGETMVGMIDEVALWNRALSNAEVAELYRRGANQIRIQVRTCSAANATTCTDGSGWKGPDGTADTFFSEVNNNANPLTADGTVLPTSPALTLSSFTSPPASNRYFQYRILLESNDLLNRCDYGSGATTCSPELVSIKTGGNSAYDPSGPSLVGSAGIQANHLTQLVETLGPGGCAGGIGYTLSLDQAVWYYWSGTAWLISDGSVGKTSTATSLSTGLPKFGAQVGRGTVYLRSHLKSNGAQTCELDQVTLHGRY